MTKPRYKLFDRVAGGISYMPASVTGCSITLAFILFALLLVGIGELAGRQFESGVPKAIGWLAALACLVAFMRFAKRHS